ncbi:MAG: arylsulfatase A-like enzyme [bacterium]|jgi:arylsulfatase A-like enzyme
MNSITRYFFLIPLLLLSISGLSQKKNKRVNHPNILFIMVDDLNDYEGVFGGNPQAKTPNIDRLAQSGLRFLNAESNVPVCQPSRNSLFTGVYPHASRDFGWTPHFKQAILKNHKTFIELFEENGYSTFGSGKLLHKNVDSYWSEWGVPEAINYGPNASDGIKNISHPSVQEPFRSINSVDGSFASLSDMPMIPDGAGGLKQSSWTYGKKAFKYVNDKDRDLMPDEMHAQWIATKIKTLEEGNSIQPFFMGVGFVKPHTPLYAPQKYFDLFPLESIQLPVILKDDIKDTFYKTVYPPSEMGLLYYQKLKESYPDDEGLKKFLQAYLACIAFVDDQIGVVLDALDKSKFRDNTIVILTSDHGWQMGQKEYLYKNSPWEESTRIPFIVRAPGITKPGSTVLHPVSLIDIYPTLVDLCSLRGNYTTQKSKSSLGGYSLKYFLKNSTSKRWKGPNGALTVMGVGINQPIEGIGVSVNKDALWHIEIVKDLDSTYVMQQNYSYRTELWRYIRYHNGTEELYNHKTDVHEWYNLAENPKYSKILKRLNMEMLEIIN